ncbi:alpha/beta fold hydrolase [Leptolyngbya sp. O-77]|uniref:alpha/beta fold hydrolase n=1 Tax=Leptolyngbya sp. O-77 TaxID=1080068 RepID=UPI00074D30AD|nr:alpha/beta hydrolase [Leptolyngbya sp. O-77]BAU44817.1 2-succinyl-6-hydroxy-2, 4-cyclohexadiene-1-carboxylate synthase [Leptolyngbya sp. O-77]
MMNVVDVLGTPHAYERTAPTQTPITLVFIHGWLLSRAYWQPVIQQLAPNYTCLSYDLRGFGDSQRGRAAMRYQPSDSSPASPYPASTLRQPANGASGSVPGELAAVSVSSQARAIAPQSRPGYTPSDYACDLEQLLETLDISNVWLIGHSLGGSIALWAADRMPDRVKGVTCVNSGGGIYLKEEFERFRAAGQQLVKLRPRWLCHLPLVDLMMTYMNVARPIDRAWGRQRLVDWVSADPAAAIGALLDSTTETEVHRLPQVVSRLSQPVYFIAGENDTVMEPQYVLHLASFHHLFQQCGQNVVQIPDCGHLAMIEQTDAVVTHLQAILAQHVADQSLQAIAD